MKKILLTIISILAIIGFIDAMGFLTIALFNPSF
jgi:hypothetical protein